MLLLFGRHWIQWFAQGLELLTHSYAGRGMAIWLREKRLYRIEINYLLC
jgi:hypothetical protein